jgi:Myb/SANT-like DNA-binding domain
LDVSLTRESVEQRNKAWETITTDFNNAQIHNISRDISELKTKFKNMKAQQKTNVKSEGDSSRSITYTIIEKEVVEEVPDRRLRNRSTSQQSLTPTTNHSRPIKKVIPSSQNYYSDFLDGLNTESSDEEVKIIYSDI